MLHPAAFAGMNARVLGTGAGPFVDRPSESGTSVVQVNVVVSLDEVAGSAMT